jgi:ARC6-like, IMS domain/DnaJ domain
VRIPLDYYRILGLPILATADQVQQSHRDRTLQLPRQEFSTHAVAARKALLNQAYDVLADDEKRRDYDARFLASTYEPAPEADRVDRPESPQHSDIEVDETQFVGALILLQELGEYESVLRLGRPYLKAGNGHLKEGRLGDPTLAKSDIILAITLACLELGREEWQQGHYDNASEALETGQELLLREGVFPAVRAEVQADLYKLRPYRILAMLSEPDEDSPQRDRGLVMLQEMLNERQGIDGQGIDQSGLGVDDFLRFIQQLRDYMTVDEQQVLFEAESRRPSAVATYLAVYALLAKGFARQEPALIRRAKGMLTRLGGRQDVYLEQSIGALLLGQPELAAKALERSQEYEPLSFIRENSQGAPDMLPGLCLYTERWMQEEVFPHYRDLATQTASLKDYFSNPQVQAYLEELPSETELSAGQWIGTAAMQPADSIAQTLKENRSGTGLATPRRSSDATVTNGQAAAVVALGGAAALGGTIAASHNHMMPNISGGNAKQNGRSAEGTHGNADHVAAPVKGGRRRQRVQPEDVGSPLPTAMSADGEPIVMASSGRVNPRDRRRQPAWLLPGLALLLTVLTGYFLASLMKSKPPMATMSSSALPTLPQTGDLNISLDQPVIAMPDEVTGSNAAGIQGEMNAASAKQVLDLWFATKKVAMGSTHAVEKLDAVLTGDKLKEWQSESIGAKADNSTITYEHNVAVTDVKVTPENPNEAVVTANIREQRNYFKDGQPIQDEESQIDDLALEYTFVRENNQWKIKNWQ